MYSVLYLLTCCSTLASVAIPPSVTEIGEGAFYDCSSLASVAIPPSVTQIGDHAFKVPYVTSPQLMSHRHASTVSRQVLVLQKKECVPAGRRTTEFLYQAYRTVGSDACSDGYSRCVQYGRFEYQF